MDLIDCEQLSHEAETCRETTDDFIALIEQQPKAEVRINLNEVVKFKLTDYGKDIYYHQYDELNERIVKRGGRRPSSPKCRK